MFGIGTSEMIVIGIIAVLLFGSRLPSVARSLGKSIIEFKKGMGDLQDEVKSSVYSEPTARVSYREDSEPTAPKFEPPKAENSEDDSEAKSDTPAEPVAK
jgi:sec-independent protein translocase protein TatA